MQNQNSFTLVVKKPLRFGNGHSAIHFGATSIDPKSSLNTSDHDCVLQLNLVGDILKKENYTMSLSVTKEAHSLFGEKAVKLESDDGQIAIHLKKQLSFKESLLDANIDWSLIFKENNDILPVSLVRGSFASLRVEGERTEEAPIEISAETLREIGS